MNILLRVKFLLILFSYSLSSDVKPKNDVEKKLLSFFSKWRSGNLESLPLTLPPLDVLNIPAMNGHYVGKGVDLKYSSSQMKLSGMNNFTVVELKVLMAHFGMHARGSLFVPTLFVSADCYQIHGDAFHVYSLDGTGKFEASFKDINVSFLLFVASSGNSSTIKDLKLNFAVDNIQVNMENSSWPINKVLNSEGVKLIDGYRPEILTAAENGIKRSFDKYLKTVTPAVLLDMISE